MKEKEIVEIEVLINGETVMLDKHVPVQTLKKRHCAYLEIKDFTSNILCKLQSGTLEIVVRESKK